MRRFSQVDVFTDEFLLGNPVAVVHDADGLDDAAMQAFARWTNLSETTFLLPPTDPSADYRLRIFTSARELPFAGHPTLGSARAWLTAGGTPQHEDRIVQECGAGLVEVRRAHRLAFAAPPLLRGGPVDADDVAVLTAGFGLRPDQVVDAQWCDNGPGWVSLLVTDAETVLGVERNGAEFAGFADVGLVGPYPPGSEAAFEVRAFVADDGIGEDPVTGSLNAAIAQWLIPTGHAPSSYVASQGTKRARRGRVHIEQDGERIWVGGDTVVGITGTVAL